jgi:hypothetical protein
MARFWLASPKTYSKDCALASVDGLDEILQSSERAHLTGNLGSYPSTDHNARSYLNSSISGEDRRAPTNTIDESVWETLSRDLLGVWEKMRLVLWPKHLLSGLLRRDSSIGDTERGDGLDLAQGIVSGRWPGTDMVLQQRMSEDLRDWDLWWVHLSSSKTQPIMIYKGPFNFLFTSKFVTLSDSLERAKDHSILWRLCSCLGWRGRRDSSNQITRWKYVSAAGFGVLWNTLITTALAHFFSRYAS